MNKKILIGGWEIKDYNFIEKFCKNLGFNSVINIDSSDIDEKLENLLKKEKVTDSKPLHEKVIIFNDFTREEIINFMNNFKLMNFSKPIFAVVTEHSINWNLSYLIEHLVEEREFFKKQQSQKN
jgi:hypothetical protein